MNYFGIKLTACGLLLSGSAAAMDLEQYAQKQQAFQEQRAQAVHVPPGSQAEAMLSSTPRAFTFITVSNDPNDPDCDFNSSYPGVTNAIQEAIDWPTQYDEIRIVEGNYDEEIDISRSVTLQGGYATCADAISDTLSSADSTDTVISPSAATGSVIDVTSSGQETVNLNNLNISGGTDSGVNTIGFTGSLNTRHVQLSQNNALAGGGLVVDSGVTATLSDSIIMLNSANIRGGGIYCGGVNSVLVLNRTVVELNNSSYDAGGGVFVDNGCEMSQYGGSLSKNYAGSHGGGVAVVNGGKADFYGYRVCALFFCLGAKDSTLQINNNIADTNTADGADGLGGGIYVAGMNSEVNFTNGVISNNSAYSGGGIALANQSTLNIRTKYTTPDIVTGDPVALPCKNSSRCTILSNNETSNFGFDSDGYGGALLVSEGSRANVTNTHIHNNRADFGLAAYVVNGGSLLDIEGSMVYANGNQGTGNFNDAYVFRIFDANQLLLHYSTIADNLQTNAIVGNDNSSVDIGSSIIHDERASAPDVYNDTGTSSSIMTVCTIAHETNSISGTAVIVDDPLFEDRNNNDFHLGAGSPAIDFCNDVKTQADFDDIDGDERAWDDPTVPGSNTFDIGADESFANDVIFKDGFD